MTIKFRCPQCDKAFSVRDDYAGKKAKCPCGAKIVVPGQKALSSTRESSIVPRKATHHIDMQGDSQGSGGVPEKGGETKQEGKHLSTFTPIGSFIGVMIGGANFGIMGAMLGGVLGSILVSPGIEVHIKDLKAKGKFHPFKGGVIVSYILAFIFTSGGIVLAPIIVENLLTSSNVKPGLSGLLVQYAGPAFAGGIGALIPVWLSAGRKAE